MKDINDDQWRLKASNNKKIIEKVVDYYENNLYLNLEPKFYPDANLIAKTNDKQELNKLIQLILVISVNCKNKQKFIHEITKLNLLVQQNLMEAIQLLHDENTASTPNPADAIQLDSITIDSDNLKYLKEQLVKTIETIKLLNQREDELNERNYDLQNQLKLKDEERSNLQKEIEKLNTKLQSIENFNSTNQKDELNEHNHQIIKLKGKVDTLEKDLLKSDSLKEELQMKIELMQTDLNKLNQLNEELQKKVKEAKQLKDELDIHKHTADKLIKYEDQIELYKKKLDQLSDYRKQINLLEDKNKLLVESNYALEEEIKKMILLKSQINDYKRQVSELHQQIIEKTHKCDKNEFDLKKITEKYENLMEESLLLKKEKHELKLQLEKTKNLESNQFSLADENDQSQFQLNKHNLNFEIKSEDVDVSEKLLRLELENKNLKSKLDAANQEDLLLIKANYEDAKQRIKEIENDNRNLNKKLIETEFKLNDLECKNEQNSQSGKNEDVLNKIDQEHLMQQLKVEIKSLKQKLSEKDHQLSRKDEQINEVEEKHKKYLEKAKQAFTLIEPVSLNSIINFNGQTSLQSNLTQYSESIVNAAKITDPNLYSNLTNEQLKQILFSTNQKLVNLNDEFTRYKTSIDYEQRLMSSSIHDLAFNLMRNSATDRLKAAGLNNSLQTHSNSFYGSTNSNLNSSNLSLNGANNSQSISFLAKQRQTTSRKINLEKVSNS